MNTLTHFILFIYKHIYLFIHQLINYPRATWHNMVLGGEKKALWQRAQLILKHCNNYAVHQRLEDLLQLMRTAQWSTPPAWLTDHSTTPWLHPLSANTKLIPRFTLIKKHSIDKSVAVSRCSLLYQRVFPARPLEEKPERGFNSLANQYINFYELKKKI